MPRVPVVGGPADGAKVPLRGAFEFIDASGRRVRHGGSALYHVVGERYVLADRDYFECGGCGSFHARGPDQCQLCGASTPPSRRGPRPD